MARRKARMPQGKKIQPAPMTLTTLFTIPEGSSYQEKQKFLDISQMASLVNRRFYRQGLEWAIGGIKFIVSNLDPTTPYQSLSVNKIPQTWVASNAWEKGFRSWQRLNREALSEADSVRPKFLDFKVYMNDHHAIAGSAANLMPISAAGNLGAGANVYTPGEWEYSKVHIAPGTGTSNLTQEYDILWTGASFTGAGFSGHDSVSLIEGYAASRGLPDINDPNTPGDADDVTGTTPENWMSAMFNDGIDQVGEVIENMIEENNQAPYPFENDGINLDTMYPGGAEQGPGTEVVEFIAFTPTSVSATAYCKPFTAPGGLIQIDAGSLADGSVVLMQVDLVPGDHRGYHCRPMKDV